MWKLIIWSLLLLNFLASSNKNEWKSRRKYKNKDYRRKYYKNSRTTISFEPENESFQTQTGYETKYYQNGNQFENLGAKNGHRNTINFASIMQADFSQIDSSKSKLMSAVSKISSGRNFVNSYKGLRKNSFVKSSYAAQIMEPDDQYEIVGGSEKIAAQKMGSQLCDEIFFIIDAGEGIINERISESPTVKCDYILEICCRLKNAQQVATTVNTPPGANTSPNTTPSGVVTTVATPSGSATTSAGSATTPIAATIPAGVATTPAGAVTTPIVATTSAATPTGAVTTPPVATTVPVATTAPPAVTTVATTPAVVPTLTTPTTTKPPTPTNATQGSTAAPTTPTLAPVTPIAAQTTPTTTRMATPAPTTSSTPSTDQCGISYVDTTKEPPAGESPFVAAFMEFPWMLVLLDYRNFSPDGRMMNNAFICGASLLSKDIALTAAHCIKGREPSSLIVRAGEWNTMFANESLPHQDRSLSKIILHPEFNNLTLFNDVAILKLDAPVMFANNVQPVCLPNAEDKYFGQNCIATGWGQNAFGPNGRYATKLRKVTLPILNQNVCEEKFRKTRLGPFFNFHESFICAGGIENYDTCTGDGGGPLVCKTGNTFTQAGIVSWGIGCGSKDVPGAYVNIPQLKPWIDSTMYNLMRDNLPK